MGGGIFGFIEGAIPGILGILGMLGTVGMLGLNGGCCMVGIFGFKWGCMLGTKDCGPAGMGTGVLMGFIVG